MSFHWVLYVPVPAPSDLDYGVFCSANQAEALLDVQCFFSAFFFTDLSREQLSRIKSYITALVIWANPDLFSPAPPCDFALTTD